MYRHSAPHSVSPFEPGPAQDARGSEQAHGHPLGPSQRPEKKPDAQQITSIVSALHKELDAVFHTDRGKVLGALRGLSGAEVAAVRREYSQHYHKDLDGLIGRSLKGNDLAEAQASLLGDRAKSYAAALRNTAGRTGIDRNKVQEILGEINHRPEPLRHELLAQVRAEYKAFTGKDLDSELSEQLRDHNQLGSKALNALTLGAYHRLDREENFASQEARALLDGNTSQAEAIKLDSQRGLLGIGQGTDSSAFAAALRACRTPGERSQLIARYRERTGKSQEDLHRELADGFKGAEEEEVLALLDNADDSDIRASAARIHKACEGFFGTDKEALFRELEGPASGPDGKKLSARQRAERRDKIIRYFNSHYAGGDPRGFDTFLSKHLSGAALHKAEQLKEQGELTDVQRLSYALKGSFFTDKKAIKEVFSGKTAAELRQLRAQYQKECGRDMNQDLAAAFGKDSLLGGGRDAFELEQALLGVPQTDAERIDRARDRYRHERGGSSVSKWLLDKVSHSGQDLDDTQRRIEELSERLHKIEASGGKLSAAEHEEVLRLTGYQQADVKAYQEAKDSTANAAATGAAVVVGGAATVATGGAAGPATAAVIGSLAGGGAGVAAKVAIKGSDYSTDDLQHDLVETGATTLTAGVGQLSRVGKGLNALLKIGPNGGGLVKEAAKGAILGTAGGSFSAGATQLLNRESYLGDGTLGEKMLRNVGGAAASGLMGGGLGGGVGGQLAQTGFGRSHAIVSSSLSGAASGLGSGFANGIIGGDLEMNWEGAAAGAISGAASAHQAIRHQQKAAFQSWLVPESAPSQAPHGARTADGQQAAQGQTPSVASEAPAPLIHHGENPAQHMAQVQQLGLGPSESIRVNNADIKIGRLFNIGDGRIAAFIEVSVNGEKHLRTVYQSNSQGSFRLLPAANERRNEGILRSAPKYDKGIGEHALQLPSPIEEALAKNLQKGAVARTSDDRGEAIMKGAAPVNRTDDDYTNYFKNPDHMRGHIQRQSLLSEPQMALQKNLKDKAFRQPQDIWIADPIKEPDYSKLVRRYQTTVATAGEVDALVFKSKDGSLEYTLMRDNRGRSWFNRVIRPDAPITAHGVHARSYDAGELVMPLWEYSEQIPFGFAGEQNKALPDYASTERYLGKNRYLSEFKSEYNHRLETRLPAVSPLALSQVALVQRASRQSHSAKQDQDREQGD